MEWISQWAVSLAFYFVFLSAVMNFLPEGEEKRYIRYYMGVLLLLFLLRPFFKIGKLEDRVEQRAQVHLIKENYEEMKREMNVIGEEDYLMDFCRDEVKHQVGKIMEKYGYKVDMCQITFGGTSRMEPTALYLSVFGKKEGPGEQDQTEVLEKALMEVYKFPPGNINIVIQE